jgi:uncharacterized protein YjbI with pentapeptide repeats
LQVALIKHATIKRGFGGLKMGHFTLIEGRLLKFDFSATALQSSQFMRCQMSRSRFSGSTLERSVFYEANYQARFRRPEDGPFHTD